MKFKIHDFVNSKGVNEFKTWTLSLQKKEQGKLREKIDKLMLHGDELYPMMLTDTPIPGIKKIRVQGPVKLRPLLCSGPVAVGQEYTMLLGAKEIGSQWAPKDAPTTANDKKNEVSQDPVKRRISHERIT